MVFIYLAALILMLFTGGCGDNTNAESKRSEPVIAITLPPELSDSFSAELKIPEDTAINFKGYQWARNNFMVPIQNDSTTKFIVFAGELESSASDSTHVGTFNGWAFCYKDTLGGEILTWGPCVTAGDLVVPDIFHCDSVPNLWVDNQFTLSEASEGCFKIEVRESRGDRLCMLVDRDHFFLLTAGYPGTKVEYKGEVFVRKSDGWYVKDRKVIEADSQSLTFASPPPGSSEFWVSKGDLVADGSIEVEIVKGEESVGYHTEDASYYGNDDNNLLQVYGNDQWFSGGLIKTVYHGVLWGPVVADPAELPRF